MRACAGRERARQAEMKKKWEVVHLYDYFSLVLYLVKYLALAFSSRRNSESRFVRVKVCLNKIMQMRAIMGRFIEDEWPPHASLRRNCSNNETRMPILQQPSIAAPRLFNPLKKSKSIFINPSTAKDVCTHLLINYNYYTRRLRDTYLTKEYLKPREL